VRPERPGDVQPHGGVPFGEALRFWCKLGFISFGGPAGQIAIMHRELVERRGWISERRFLHALNYCMLLPGPEAQQLATYVGWLMHRTRGGLAAGALFVAPSVLILFGLSYAYASFGHVGGVAGVMSGFKSVVVAIVAAAVLRVGPRAVRGWPHLLVAAGAFAGIYFLRIPFPLIVLMAASIGLAGAKLWPDAWTPSAAEADEREATDPRARAPDSPEAGAGMPLASRSLPLYRRTARILAAGVALWLLPLAALVAWLGPDSVPMRQYGFFTGAALVTFGGAYAVLAYVTQAAVHTYGWISQAQAVDGLALAETTPGPLIMVLQFVGFMTGWNHPGPLSPLGAATLGALVTTWTTFLPCFLFVFAGAPYMEELRGNRNLGAALSGVTACVIGAILNLALVFGSAVILPNGPGGSVDLFAALLAATAFMALHRYRLEAIWIVLAGGAAGLVRALLPA
jgi:chromate transporter